MSKWEIKRKHISVNLDIDKFNTKKLSLVFHREWGGILYLRNLYFSTDIYNIGEENMVQVIFNKIHEKKWYNNYIFYEFKKSELVFARKGLKCNICHREAEQKNNYELVQPKNQWGITVDWSIPKCFQCVITDKLVR